MMECRRGLLLVCGSRTFTNWRAMFETLDRFHAERSFTHVMHGAARGADTLAGKWARDRGLVEVRRPADWTRLGRRAGFVRNQEMVDLRPEMVVGFCPPSGMTNGTAHTLRIARESGLLVEEVLA